MGNTPQEQHGERAERPRKISSLWFVSIGCIAITVVLGLVHIYWPAWIFMPAAVLSALLACFLDIRAASEHTDHPK